VKDEREILHANNSHRRDASRKVTHKPSAKQKKIADRRVGWFPRHQPAETLNCMQMVFSTIHALQNLISQTFRRRSSVKEPMMKARETCTRNNQKLVEKSLKKQMKGD
jgi:hypothetical protein